MSYAAALKSSKTTPCTNVPIHCPLCPPTRSGNPATIWKYNAMTHIMLTHSDKKGNLPSLPAQLVVDMHITKAEETSMGVDEEYTEEWRDDYGIPGSDDIQEREEEIKATKSSAERGGKRRQRAPSTMEAESSSRKATKR